MSLEIQESAVEIRREGKETVEVAIVALVFDQKGRYLLCRDGLHTDDLEYFPYLDLKIKLTDDQKGSYDFFNSFSGYVLNNRYEEISSWLSGGSMPLGKQSFSLIYEEGNLCESHEE